MTRLQLKFLNLAGKKTIKKSFSIAKLSDYLQHHQNSLYTDQALIKWLLNMYRICVNGSKTYNQKDLEICWNLQEPHQDNEELSSLFILLLA